MPRKTPLPEREVAICNRLREFREMTQLSRVAFARKAGVDSSLLVRYDFLLTPVRYGPAYRLISTYGVNPGWLATGIGPRFLSLSMPDPSQGRELQQELFSSVYDTTLGTGLNQKAKRMVFDMADRVLVTFDDSPHGRVLFMQQLIELAEDAALLVPGAHLNGFLETVLTQAYKLLRSYPKEADEAITRRNEEMRDLERRLSLGRQLSMAEQLRTQRVDCESEDKALTHIKDSFTMLDVTRTLPSRLGALLARVRIATDARGSKAALAKELDVSPQRLNGWLNGGCLPDGDVTLRLLKWVLGAEAQQQDGPGRTANAPKAKKTQRKNRSNDKSQTSGPKPK